MFLSALCALSVLSQDPQRPAPGEASVDEKRLVELIEKVARQAVEKDGVPGLSVLVGRDGEALLAKGWGYADAKRGEPASENTSYSIGSLTQQFTAAAVLQLVEAQKLDLGAPVDELLPGFPTQGHKVTVRDLLMHTSGVPGLAKIAKVHAQRKAVDAQSPKPDAAKKDEKRDEKDVKKDGDMPRKEPDAIARRTPLQADPVDGIQEGKPKPQESGKGTEPGAKSRAASAEDEKPRRALDPKELAALFRDVPFDFEPGKGRSTDSADYLLLGLIVARVSGEHFDDYVRAHLLEPLELATTVFCPLDGGTQGFADDCLTPADESAPEIPGLDESVDALHPLCSTVGDLFRWQQALHSRTLFGEESTRLLLNATSEVEPAAEKAQGSDELREAGPWHFESHTGDVIGFRSRIAHFPDARLTIVVLANCATAPVDRIEKEIARQVLGLVPPDVEVADLPLEESDVARYSGRYQIATTIVRIFERDGKLWYETPTQPALRLLYQGRHLFVAEVERDMRITFQVVDDKPAEAFTILRAGLMSTGKRME